jgi:hypothetical protein
LSAGAGILLYRTIALIAGGARKVLERWVVWLTFLEMAIDVVTFGSALRWWRSKNPDHARSALVAGACATLVHAGRVAVFVVGRTGPWIDFDVREDARADHDERWTWPQVVFAGTLSTFGVVGVVVIWIVRTRRVAVESAGSVLPLMGHTQLGWRGS